MYYTCHGWDMPNQPKTPARTIRIDDELWDAVQREAKAKGESMSDVVRKSLRKHLGMALVALAGALVGATTVLGVSSAMAGPSMPYIAVECRQAVQISKDYNATSDQSERSALYDAYLDRSGVCLSYPTP